MKKLLTIALLALTMNASAAQPNDTIVVNQAQVTKWIVDETTNTKGAPVKKYYAIYNGELLSTSKTVYEKASLCQKHGAKLSLIAIGKKKNGKFVAKRIAML